MKKGYLFSGISFIVTTLFILMTYQNLPSTIITQVRIDQLFTQSGSLEWEKSTFLFVYLATLFAVNLIVGMLSLLFAKKPQLLLKGLGFEKFAAKSSKQPNKQQSPVLVSYTGVYVNIVLLFAYMMTAHLNGINIFLPYFVVLALFIMATLWFVFWIFKYARSYDPSSTL